MTRIQFLSKEEIKDIHRASLEVLEKTGVVIKNPDAVDLLRKNGCTIDSETVKIPEALVEESVEKVPDSFKLFSRDGKDSMEVGGDNVIFNPASTAIYFSDRETGEIRRAETPDMVQLTRLVDTLENIQAQSTAVVPSDVPTSIADLYRIYAILKNSTKPIITGAFSKETMIDNINLLGAVAGGVESLAEKPLAVFDCCPSSPLHWSEDTSQNLIDCATYGIPANIVPAPLMGATSPVTISGTLIQANVEFLSGVVISQLVKPGAIVVSGGAISVLDMRYGTNRMGGIEAVMAACAAAEIGKYYGIPTYAYLGVSDSNLIDAQGGFESALGLMFAALARVNLATGPGMLSSINCQSLEKMVLDNEICGSALRLLNGVNVEGVLEIVDLIQSVGPGGHFLKEKHTSQKFRDEQFFPSDVISRLPPDSWKSAGSKDFMTRSKEQVDKILSEHIPKPLSNESDMQLDQVFKAILKKYDVRESELPSVT